MKSVILLFFVFSIFSMSGCDFIEEKIGGAKKTMEKSTSSQEVKKSREEVVKEVIEAQAKKYFPNSATTRNAWIERQLEACAEISSYMPNIPIKEFSEIRERSEAKYPYDYVERRKYLFEQTEAYIKLESSNTHFSSSDWKIVSDSIDKCVVDDYVKKLEKIEQWREACYAINSKRSVFSNKEFDKIKKEILTKYLDNPAKISQVINNMAVAKHNYANHYMGRIHRDTQILLKNRLDEIYGTDYLTKYEKLKDISLELIKRPNISLEDLISGLKLPEQYMSTDQKLRARAEKIFRESIFTIRGPEEAIYSAALVKMKGKTVVLATKDFIPTKFPVIFANSKGKVICSKAYVSDSHPMVLFIPDYEPTEFTPIDVVEPADVSNIFDRELFMIAPYRGGFTTLSLFVFSEDKDYLNLTSDTNPHTSYSTSLRRLDRDGNKLLVSITKKMDIGENSVVIDSKTGKLVSMAIRVFNPGVISWRGKTGSIIGYEEFSIPDASTFIRQFNGTANKTDIPRGAIRFVRMTAFESWKPLVLSRFWEQKNEIREFTDSNNDFIQFFMRNSFYEALRSNRIARVAEKYRKPLLRDNLTRNFWEDQYRKYMLEVSYLLKRELMSNKNPEDFYSIYREEYKYQLALRKTMHDYIANAVKDSNIVNLIHTDLATRHRNSQSTGGRIGGSIGGGY